MDPEIGFVLFHVHTDVAKEPPVFILLVSPKVAARAGHGYVVDAFQPEVKHLVKVPGNHVLNSILPRQSVQRKIRMSGNRVEKPRRPV